MKRTKVITVIGTRPEIIRLSRVMPRLDEHFDHVIVHTGQNYDYELNKIFFEDLELREPDIYLDAAGSNAASTIGRIIERFDVVLEEQKPDALLVLGDTNSCLAAIPAKRRKVPIFHMEAGNRCFDERVPEETNRRIVDHIADINMPYSDIAREYLLREGIKPDRIIKTGSPMYEVLHYYMPKIQASNVLQRLGLKKGEYFVISCHREENIDNNKYFFALLDVLNKIADTYKQPIIFSTHPRTRKRLEKSAVKLNQLILISKPFGFFDYIRLQIDSRFVLSDSGTISEEASILSFPAINIRETHERPEGMEEATVLMCSLANNRIFEVMKNFIDLSPNELLLNKVKDYCVPNVSKKIDRIIISYIDFINSNTWFKN